MSNLWVRKSKPLTISLVDQLLMVAADVDNDLFDAGAADNVDREAIANLVYRVTAFYSGRDEVLGTSAGLKHFGTRRLDRSGLANRPPSGNQPPATDNVWDIDCSSFFPATVGGIDIHSAYFNPPGTLDLMRQILRGIDRTVLNLTGVTQGHAWLPAPAATPINDSSKR